MGLWKGASDLFIARVCGGYGGYWIELKKPGGKLTDDQIHFLDCMTKEGYKTDCFDNWEAAKSAIENYIEKKEFHILNLVEVGDT